MNTPIRYSYRIPSSTAAGGLLVSLVMVVGFGYMALTNTRGLSYHGISLSVTQATVFWSVIALISIVGFALCIFIALRSLKGPVEIVLENDFLLAPAASLKLTMLRIPYVQITQVREQQIRQAKLLIIESTVGQSRMLPNGFGSDFMFEEFKQKLDERLRQSKSQGRGPGFRGDLS